jgi:hypothetical protein
VYDNNVEDGEKDWLYEPILLENHNVYEKKHYVYS